MERIGYVLLDVEIALNSKALSYIEDNVKMPILRPNSLIYKSSMILEDDPVNITDKELRKRVEFMKKCKEAVCLRWRHKYLMDLLERHKVLYGKEQQFKVGYALIIKGMKEIEPYGNLD